LSVISYISDRERILGGWMKIERKLKFKRKSGVVEEAHYIHVKVREREG